MLQIFPNGEAETSDSANTENSLFSSTGNAGSGTSEDWTSDADYTPAVVVPVAGTLSNLYIKLSAAANHDYTFTIYKNTAATAFSVTVSTGQTTATSVGSLSVSAGDVILIHQTVSSFGAPLETILWSISFAATDTTKAIICSTNRDIDWGGVSGPNFDHIYSGIGWNTVLRDFVCPMDGTITDFYVFLERTLGGTGGVSFSLYKNGSEEASTVLTFSSSDTLKSATGLSLTFSAGDTLKISHTGTGTPSAVNVRGGWGIAYQPAVAGQMMVGGMTRDNLSTTQNDTQYGFLCGPKGVQGTESNFKQVFGAGATLSKFRVLLATAPGASQTREFRIRQNGGAANQIVTISGSNTSGSDGSNTDTFALGDTVNISTVSTTAASASSRASWSAILTPILASASPSVSPSVSPSQSPSVSPSRSPSVSPSVSPSFGLEEQVIHLVGSNPIGNVQLINAGKSDDGESIYYELETQDLEFGNRGIIKAIYDKLGIVAQHASGSHIEVITDEKDPIPLEVGMGKRVNVITLPQLKGYYITLRWSGETTNKSPVLEGFYLNKITSEGIHE